MDPQACEWFDRPGEEPVELHEPSLHWQAVAARWAEEIREALKPLRVRVEHVGSTAVPGLVSKPVVDLQVSVPDLEDEPAYRPRLEALGVVMRLREPGHRFFRPPADQPRTIHIHVCAKGSDWERDHLLFRDHLRCHPGAADAYAELKRSLAAEVGHDRVAYTEGKSAFIKGIVGTARREVR